MALREDVADALCISAGGDDWQHWLPEADAALAVMAAEHSRRVELALGRINEVRVRLGLSLSECDVTLVTLAATLEMRTSLLDAMTQLQGMLPAESAAKWAEKLTRQP